MRFGPLRTLDIILIAETESYIHPLITEEGERAHRCLLPALMTPSIYKPSAGSHLEDAALAGYQQPLRFF